MKLHQDIQRRGPTLMRALTAIGGVMLVMALMTGELIGQQPPDAPPAKDAPAKDAPPKAAATHAPAEPRQRVVDMVKTAEDIENIEDPLILDEAGRHYLKAGDEALAQKLFETVVTRDEINLYTNFAGTPFGEAIIMEKMGQLEKSRAKWREMIELNVLDTYFFMRHYSTDNQKEMLLTEAVEHIKKVVADSKAGKDPRIYTTRKGAKRALKTITMEEAMASFEKGERLRYVYIDELDLTGKTFDKRVGCVRCVAGSIKGWDASFNEQFDFVGIVLGDVHLGKKWKGEVNKSASLPGSTFNRLYLNKMLILGNLNLDSVKVTGRVANLPLTIIEGDVNMRNAEFKGVAEFRFTHVTGALDAKGAEFFSSSYFGHTHFGGINFARVVAHENPVYFNSATFAGPANFEKCEFYRGATFEAAHFDEDVTLRQSRIRARLNFSRAIFRKNLTFSQIELTDLDFLGSVIEGEANFGDSVFSGSVRFALDGLTRRLHLQDANPLHKLYKQYQGDDDADKDLTFKGQYGVVHVDDLTAKLRGNVSFANTIFQKFVNFEGVQFGSAGKNQLASFFNTQFYGEAHFERTVFNATADFRTIFGNEVAFNQASFRDTWMLDDANVPGRLSMSGARLEGEATISFYGARIASFGITFAQLIDDAKKRHRLFHERCVLTEGKLSDTLLADPRLVDASWDAINEREITDPAEVLDRARRMCIDRAIGEFVMMKDSFSKRGMGDENDWAYWHLRHYKNSRTIAFGGASGKVIGALTWVIFEKGFGWGVRLSNLLGTGLVVVLVFVLLLRLFCADMLVDWDNETIKFRDLPLYAMFMVSFHSFLGRARDWKSKVSPGTFKVLYTTEMIIGIILITFFIGAYTRMVLR